MNVVINEIGGIFGGLGVDSTIWVQLGLFLFILTFLWKVTFEPYLAAFDERQNQTEGNQDEAEQIAAQTRELENIYQRNARGLNTDIKSVFDRRRLEAQKEHERLVVEAKDKAKGILDSARSTIESEYNRAREELLKESPAIGKSIASRLLSKEL